MAKIMRIVDDLDGSSEGDVETVQFAVGGAHYEIDLSAANRDAFFRAFDVYIASARPSTNGRSVGPGDDNLVRKWAQENGVEVGKRGRIPTAVREQYEKSQAE